MPLIGFPLSVQPNPIEAALWAPQRSSPPPIRGLLRNRAPLPSQKAVFAGTSASVLAPNLVNERAVTHVFSFACGELRNHKIALNPVGWAFLALGSLPMTSTQTDLAKKIVP